MNMLGSLLRSFSFFFGLQCEIIQIDADREIDKIFVDVRKVLDPMFVKAKQWNHWLYALLVSKCIFRIVNLGQH